MIGDQGGKERKDQSGRKGELDLKEEIGRRTEDSSTEEDKMMMKVSEYLRQPEIPEMIDKRDQEGEIMDKRDLGEDKDNL